jgi:hypothetical protein
MQKLLLHELDASEKGRKSADLMTIQGAQAYNMDGRVLQQRYERQGA